MNSINFSKNKKLNGLLNDIYTQLLEMRDTKDESLNEIERYIAFFPRESDNDIVQHGNLLIYYDNVRSLYKDYGYKIVDKWSNNKLWETYKRQVGFVARYIFQNEIKH